MSHPFPLLFSIMITTMITTRTSTTAVNDPAIAGTWFGANEKKKNSGCEFYEDITENYPHFSLVHSCQVELLTCLKWLGEF